MINLMVLFGGESCEHDISIITGVQLLNKANEYLYNIIPVYIDKNGDWLVGKNLDDLDNYPDNLGKVKKCGLIANDNYLYISKSGKLKRFIKIDVAILCLHGVNGEDGSVAGLLQLSKIPYMNSSLLPSSVAMDKVIFNYFIAGLGIEKAMAMDINYLDYELNTDEVINKINEFGLPVIIKPSRQGSSIGIKVCREFEKLKECLEFSFEYDDRVLIEEYVNIEKEVNIACFLDKTELIFSKTEEPITNSEMLSFEDKYIKKQGFEGIKRISPARISSDVEKQIKDIATKIYFEMDMFGVVRFDFIITKDKRILINEVNSIPGSMANYLFDDKYNYMQLIELWINNALLRSVRQKRITKSVKTNVLESGKWGVKK